MKSATLRRGLVGAGLVAVGAVALGRRRFDRATESRVDALLSAAEPRPDWTVDESAYSDCPGPVREYFRTVLPAGRLPIRSARLTQRGAFRPGGRSGDWKPMRATQYYAVDPPGFVWDASIDLVPFLPTRVVDAYERGHGSLRAAVLSTVPVARAGPSPGMDESELQRYLAEAVWFPTALLPREGVAWEAVDDSAARATLEDRTNTASLVFHFDADGLVDRVRADARYRQEADDFAPWTGHFEDYRRTDGLVVPTSARVEWDLPDGELPYWRARIESFEFDRARTHRLA